MAVTINGTSGISGVDGSVGTPAVQGTDGNTGVFFPAADTVAITTGGSERIRINSGGQVEYIAGTAALPAITTTGDTNTGVFFPAADTIAFAEGGVESMRIDSSGNLLVGTTTLPSSGGTTGFGVEVNASRGQLSLRSSVTSTSFIQVFYNTNGLVGSIQTSGSATSFVTSSDYRLKNTIAPMTGALAKVTLLKPCTYKWNVDGSDGQGFIAHELAEVVPACVSGVKDAVDVDGNPEYQGIDTSFLVATLTAAIQEQQALITALTARITALEAK